MAVSVKCIVQFNLLAPLGRQAVLGQSLEAACRNSYTHPRSGRFIEETLRAQIGILPLASLVIRMADVVCLVATASCNWANS